MNSTAGHPFTLPHGYVDAQGALHREGVMRLATAMDEIAPLKEAKVQSNPGYLGVILLARVVSRLGELNQVTPRVIEELAVADFAYLQALYRRLNEHGHSRVAVSCPECAYRFEVEVDESGEP
jgi:phage FluMu protein gp41